MQILIIPDVHMKPQLSCDVFSTYRDGSPIGPCAFPVVDTETWIFEQVK